MQDAVEKGIYTTCTKRKMQEEKNAENQKVMIKVIHIENSAKMEKKSYTRSYKHYPQKMEAKNRFT